MTLRGRPFVFALVRPLAPPTARGGRPDRPARSDIPLGGACDADFSKNGGSMLTPRSDQPDGDSTSKCALDEKRTTVRQGPFERVAQLRCEADTERDRRSSRPARRLRVLPASTGSNRVSAGGMSAG
jgi:hypothetical protein